MGTNVVHSDTKKGNDAVILQNIPARAPTDTSKYHSYVNLPSHSVHMLL